jgi:hypothetical protein
MSHVTVVSTRVTPRLRLNLVASEDFEAGDTVLQCSKDEIQETRTWRTVQVDVDRHLKNEFLAYVDHSCDPNTVFDVDALRLKAIRDIPKGHLVTFFYPGSEVELAQAFECNCGATSCLKTVKGAFYLTREQMRWALDQGFCTSFIEREFRRLLAPSG